MRVALRRDEIRVGGIGSSLPSLFREVDNSHLALGKEKTL